MEVNPAHFLSLSFDLIFMFLAGMRSAQGPPVWQSPHPVFLKPYFVLPAGVICIDQ